MQVADVQDGETVKQRRQIAPGDDIMADLDALGIPEPAPVQTRELQRPPNEGLHGIPVLDMEEVEATAEDARLVISLDPEPLFRMEPSETPLQCLKNIRLHAWASAGSASESPVLRNRS
ncbi:MAG TPA: hypothetical protein VLT86_09245 [Vicinamibacterales bacterium]|nr:hypothetical protein [Vicinamibacterales bacterium]